MRYTWVEYNTTSQKLLLDVMTVSMNALHRWARPHRTYTMNLVGFIYSYTRRHALCAVGGMGGAALNTSPAATGRECHPGAEARTTQDIGRLSPHDDSGLTWPIPCGIRDSTAQRLAVVAVASLAPLIFHNLEEFSFSAKKKKKKKNSQFGSNVEGVYPDS